jgi:poly-gamma-glutamate synthesis protein (capsule biosynthesis protein)
MSSPSFVAVGDVMLGDSAICVGFGFRSRCESGERLAAVLDQIRSRLVADLVIGNLETPLSESTTSATSRGSRQMRGLPSYARALADSGFTHLSVANNHALQHGVAAFEETLFHLDDAGIRPLGLRGSDGWCCTPVRENIHGRSIGLLAYCRRPRQYGVGESPFAEGSVDEICGDVQRLAGEVQHVVVSMHWGEEFVRVPARAEVVLGRHVLDAGATMLLGHHPHVARPVELTNDRRVIAYSLGNFAADMLWQKALREGLLLRGTLSKDGIQDLQVERLIIDDNYAPRANQTALPSSPETVDECALDVSDYARAVALGLSAQRRAAYAYVLRNVLHFSPTVLAELVTTTVRNKLSGGGIARTTRS